MPYEGIVASSFFVELITSFAVNSKAILLMSELMRAKNIPSPLNEIME